MKSQIQFVNEKIKISFQTLQKDNPVMYKLIKRAFVDIEENAFCGVQIPKKLIPKEYLKKNKIKNLWKYNLPNAWRLLYSIEGNQICILSIILEWFDHKDYERKFRY